MTQGWNEELEKEFKETIKTYFDDKIRGVLDTQNALEIGNILIQKWFL